MSVADVRDRKCLHCGTPLKGKQRKFCKNSCKVTWHKQKKAGLPIYHAQRIKGLRKKLEYIEAKGGSCQSCGYSKNAAALTFHHKDPTSKSFTLDLRHFSNTADARLRVELEKCDLLCFNCHMELHNPDLELAPLLETYQDPDFLRDQVPGLVQSEYVGAPPTRFCKRCGKGLKHQEKYCSKACERLARRKVERPPPAQLAKDRETLSWHGMGKKYGVNHKTVKKWCTAAGVT